MDFSLKLSDNFHMGSGDPLSFLQYWLRTQICLVNPPGQPYIPVTHDCPAERERPDAPTEPLGFRVKQQDQVGVGSFDSAHSRAASSD